MAGITIPHFCWHPALGKAGACRVCAVKVLEGTPAGIQMSCMLAARDGMVVSTTDEEACSLRRSVIEWLMINHPHDCPVCDEGGECQLQDFTIAGGHGIRRYDGRKRTHRNQYLGRFIQHEMNRCIQCYRCARFYQEYAGGEDFGVLGRAGMVYFGRHDDGELESPFSGNLVDICPTGVFTDKTARFRARYWDYDMAPSVCPHCSLGCNTIPMARYRELLKVSARHNRPVNGWFICDHGRFSLTGINDATRPRQALIDGLPANLGQALDTLAHRLNQFLELHSPSALAIVASPRIPHEGAIMAARLRDILGAGALCYFGNVLCDERTREAASAVMTHNVASQEDVRRSDLVIIMECNLLDEAPMMALAVRQAWRSGAAVFQVGSECPIDIGQHRLFQSTAVASIDEVQLDRAQRPVIICGTRHTGLDAIRDAAAAGVAVTFLLDGPNALGCAMLAEEHGAVSLSSALSTGQIRGILSFEADLPDNLPDGISIIGAADWKQSSVTGMCGVFLPTTAWVEHEGTFINNEGRAQRFRKVFDSGQPIKCLDPPAHPPREHRQTASGSDLAPSERLIAQLLERIGSAPIDEPLSGPWHTLRTIDPEGEGLLLGNERNHA